jgi:spermidine synthase
MDRLRVVYGGVIFLSAFLLFLVEPMAAKQLLPVLGGSSSVWVTCLVFFQAALLLGYLYAWWMARLPDRRRRELHAAMLAVALSALLLPVVTWHAAGSFRLLTFRGEEAALHPVWTIFLAMAAPIGVPFVVLGSTSPLLQALLARNEGAVPYRLFALSNVGSLLALILYPVVVEPRMTLGEQWGLWLAGFVIFVGVSGWLVWRSSVKICGSHDNPTHGDGGAMNGAPGVVAGENAGILRFAQNDNLRTSFDNQRTRHDDREITRGRRWMWFLLPLAAAMQLSAVTSHLSQDIAAIPLLWILPLATYLVTFILAFEMPGLYRRWIVGRFLAVMLGSLGYALSKVDTRLPVGLAVLFFLVEIFVACWFCHAEVYRLRPAGARESTVFYLLVAAGGVAGTFLVGIASPLIFRANYDLAIAFLVTAILAGAVTWKDGWAQRLLWCTGSVLLLGLAVAMHVQFERHALMTARNFYGSLRVNAADFDDQGDVRAKNGDGSAWTGTGPVRVLMNGRIRHGMQMMESADRRKIPTTYYGEDSGVGVALRNCCEGRARNVGVVGLGAGTIAAYGEAGDRMRFYEINPLVEPIAQNLFTYLRDSAARISVVEGDGRAMLTREAPQGFDVLVVDAFSGDAIPLHLLTREAMEVYRRQLAAGGVIAFHVSNSYLNLAPAIARLADAEGMQARVVENEAVPAEGAYRATWVLVSAGAGFFARPGVSGVAMEIARQPGLRLWTDDYSSLLPVLRLGR